MTLSSLALLITTILTLVLHVSAQDSDNTTTNTFACPTFGISTRSDQLGPFFIPDTPFRKVLAPIDQITNTSLKLTVIGQVYYGNDCAPLPYTLVEPWYAGLPDENGDLYSVSNSAQDYRARLLTDECGKFKYIATFPSIYASRPIHHIHYRFSTWDFTSIEANATHTPTSCGNDIPGSVGSELLVTQMYFNGFIPTRFNPHRSQIVDIVLNEQDDNSKVVYWNVHINSMAPSGLESNNTCSNIQDDIDNTDDITNIYMNDEPTCSPTLSPSSIPSITPSESPSSSPTLTSKPTSSSAPTTTPSVSPSDTPTLSPSSSKIPSDMPSLVPTNHPTTTVTLEPTTSTPIVDDGGSDTNNNGDDGGTTNIDSSITSAAGASSSLDIIKYATACVATLTSLFLL